MKGKNLNFNVSLFIVILYSIFLTLIVRYLEPTQFSEIINLSKNNNLLVLLLNLLPIFLLIVFMFFLTNNIFYSCGTASFIFIVFSIVNTNKIILRQIPFVFTDLLLGAEFITISKSLPVKIIIITIFLCLFLIFLTIILGNTFKTQKLNFKKRIVFIFIFIFSILTVNKFVYSSRQIYDFLPVNGSYYNLVDQFNSKGFVFSFLYNLNTTKIHQPKNYSKQEIKKFIENYKLENGYENKNVNVVVIMSEAFSDFSLSDAFVFEKNKNPLKNYEKIINDPTVENGHILVPNHGGGTADTEFDFLTGINTRQFRGVSYSHSLIKKEIESIPNVLTKLNYTTVSIHPYFPWFYNRQNVYKNFNFQQMYFLDDFINPTNMGGYVSDKDVTNKIIEVFNNKGNKPIFEFIVNIQNHGGYENKYPETLKFNTNLQFTNKETDYLENYFYGLQYQDEQIKDVTEYLNTIDEPTIFLYFGDHLPSIPIEINKKIFPYYHDTKQNIYKNHNINKMEHPEIEYFFTPYFIWKNDKAKQILKPTNKDDQIFSSFYLSNHLLNTFDLEYSNKFYNYLNKVEQQAPIILENYVYDSNLNKIENVKDISNYKSWNYYKIMEK